jgi:flavin reductase (DIM6/NTAB) family NADH-FMN oxidoreductase RutF
MKQVNYMAAADQSMTQIKKGAFLTVKAGDALNTMTIGWALLGIVWGKPVLMVAVRLSRYTFGLMEKAADFTVSIPARGMEKELDFCGTQSGRDYDKFKECNLPTAAGQQVVSPIIQMPGRHYECKIIYKSAMNPAYFDSKYEAMLYPQKDYHTLYFGEILECYEIA